MHRIGALIPATNQVVEPELFKLIYPNHHEQLSIHFSRLNFSTRYSNSPTNYLNDLRSSIPESIARLKDLPMKPYGLFCTSLSPLLKGEYSPKLVTPIDSFNKAIQAIGLNCPMIVSVYKNEIAEKIISKLDLDNYYHKSVLLENISRDTLFDFGITDLLQTVKQMANARNFDGILIFCTNIPTLHVIDSLEREFDVPVLTSNQVTMWYLLKATGFEHQLNTNHGMIFNY